MLIQAGVSSSMRYARHYGVTESSLLCRLAPNVHSKRYANCSDMMVGFAGGIVVATPSCDGVSRWSE